MVAMGIAINALTAIVLIGAMVAAFIYSRKGKKYLPFFDKAHAEVFGWGLPLLLLFSLPVLLREEPMVDASFSFLQVVLGIAAVWFYLTGKGPFTLSKWGMGRASAIFIAQIGLLFVFVIGFANVMDSEEAERRAYIQQTDPTRYAALVAEEERERQAEAAAQAEAQRAQRQQAAQAAAVAAKEAEQEEQERRKAEAEQKEKDYEWACRNRVNFFTMANFHVKEMLKSPRTAQFPSMNDANVVMEPFIDTDTLACGWSIKSFVDARNSFNALVRTPFHAVLILPKDGDSEFSDIRLVGVNILER